MYRTPISIERWLFGALPLTVAFSLSASVQEEVPLLEHDILPILTKQCMGCHGGLKQKGGLDLRTLPSMLKGGDAGPAVVAGEVEESELWLQIAEDDMPKGDKKLSGEEKEVIRQWIASGMPSYSDRKNPFEDPKLPSGEHHDPLEVAAVIDRHVDQVLGVKNVTAASPSDDIEFMRRLYLDLNGRIPTSEQARKFLDDPAKDKRSKLINELLERPEFGEQLGRTWRDWIAPPELPSDANSGTQPVQQTRKLGVWFAERFNAGDSWDKIVRDLLLVKGEIKHHPQLIFYGLVGQQARTTPSGSANAVASLFMGVQMQCAQCHDDPYRDWSQKEFWSMAAFFGKVGGDFQKINESEGDGSINIPDSAFRNSGTAVPVAFLGENEMSSREKTAWRPVLVDWLTARENPFFARAFANRLWFYLFARGLVNPVDDMRELNPPSHPGLLTLLANEFKASEFDIKHLIRAICNSAAYQRSSIANPEWTDRLKARQLALFGRSPLKVMTADMLFESLKLAFGDPNLDLRTINKKDGNSDGESAPVGDPYMEFHRNFGTNEEDATDFTHGIPQMLAFINHPRLLQGSKVFTQYRKESPDSTPAEHVEWLYLSTLSRRPSGAESNEAIDYLSASGHEEAAYNDLLWMLVNRSEFICLR